MCVCIYIYIYLFIYLRPASWSSGQSLTTNHEVPGSIPGSTVGIFLEGEDSRGDHGLGGLVEFRFKAPLGTTSSSITTDTPSGQRNCASWASQLQKSVTLLPWPGGRTTKSTKDMWWHWNYVCVCVCVCEGHGVNVWNTRCVLTDFYFMLCNTKSVHLQAAHASFALILSEI